MSAINSRVVSHSCASDKKLLAEHHCSGVSIAASRMPGGGPLGPTSWPDHLLLPRVGRCVCWYPRTLPVRVKELHSYLGFMPG